MVIGRAPGWYLQVGMQKGPLCTSVCCVAVLGVLFPLTTTMFHVVKGGHVYSFLFLKKVWLKLDSVCCHSQHSRLHCKRQGNVTTPSWWGIYFILLFFLFFGGEEAFRDLTWNPLIAHLVYLSKLQFIWSAQQLAGRACVTFSWKIHFTSRRQKFPVRATFTF